MAALPLCVALAVGCQEPNQYQEPPPPTVTVAEPLVKTVTNFLEETGTTEPVQKVDVRARVRGFLEKINFEPGTDVKKGDVLYIIEQRQYKAKVDAAKANLDAKNVELGRAETEFKRQEKLFAENATAEQQVVKAKAERDSALAAVDASKAELDQAQLNLEYTEVRAPIDGRVGKTLVKLGNLVDNTEATHLTTIVSYDPIYVNFNISERALLNIIGRERKEGREPANEKIKLYIRRATDSGFPFEGHFDYADLAVDQSTGTYMIRGIFKNPDLDIVPGLFVRVRVPIGVNKDALLVPEEAVGADQAGRFVLTVTGDNKVERHNVTVGAKHGELMVVSEGLKVGERIVVVGVQHARPGAKVTPELTKLSAEKGDIETVQRESPDAAEDAPKKKTAAPPAKKKATPPGTEKPTKKSDDKSSS